MEVTCASKRPFTKEFEPTTVNADFTRVDRIANVDSNGWQRDLQSVEFVTL